MQYLEERSSTVTVAIRRRTGIPCNSNDNAFHRVGQCTDNNNDLLFRFQIVFVGGGKEGHALSCARLSMPKQGACL